MNMNLIMKSWHNILSAVLFTLIIQACAVNSYAETSSKPASSAEPISEGAVVNSGGTALPNLFTGTMSYSIPIEVPAGRKGVQPQLALTYQSNNGNGWVGVGWDLSVGAIERGARYGVNFQGNDFILRMNGVTLGLVPDISVSGLYHSEIEGTFYRIKKLTADDGRSYWEVTDKAGVRYIYGRTAVSRQYDTSTPNPDNIFKWCLEQVIDTNGNYMTYTYTTDNGQIYLDKIEYTANAGQSLTPTVRNRQRRSARGDSYN